MHSAISPFICANTISTSCLDVDMYIQDKVQTNIDNIPICSYYYVQVYYFENNYINETYLCNVHAVETMKHMCTAFSQGKLKCYSQILCGGCAKSYFVFIWQQTGKKQEILKQSCKDRFIWTGLPIV